MTANGLAPDGIGFGPEDDDEGADVTGESDRS